MKTTTLRTFSTEPRSCAAGWNTLSPADGFAATLCAPRNRWFALALLLVLLLVPTACVTTGSTANTMGLPYNPDGASPEKLAKVPPGTCPTPPPLALPAEGSRPDDTATPGSLWTPASISLYHDVKASRVGDVLTITVRENSDASKQATTKTGRYRDNSADLNITGLTAGGTTVLKPVTGGYTANFDNNFKGSGLTTKTDKMTAYMTATVVDILPNGNLFIRGARWTKVNEELQQIILEGVVRPTDISRNNEILSQKIGDAKIFFVGKGPVSTQQRPGWLGQLFDFINPF